MTRAALAALIVVLVRGDGGNGLPSSTTSSSSTPPSSFPSNFEVNNALEYFATESRSLLASSMEIAGFDVDEMDSYDDRYLDFATRALDAEMHRIGKIRDSLLKKKYSSKGGGGSCSTEDHEAGICVAAATTTVERYGRDLGEGVKNAEFEHFVHTSLQPGQVDLLRWANDNTIVQEYGARVGLPPQLVPTLIEYARDMGLLDIMTNMLYDDPLPPDAARWFSFQSPYQTNEPKRNFTWNVERPAKKWKSDMHWFNTADELSHEDSLRALAKGGFDDVLRGIGERFNLDELHVDSFGFVAVTECERGFIHTDWEDTDGRAFNFLVGILSPEGAGPELVVSEGDRRGETYYGTNSGVLVGDYTRHGTRECDHRSYRGVRITASIYLADVTEDNVGILAGDTTSIFPPMADVGEEWIWSQRGRHWRKGDGGSGIAGDLGRAPFSFQDKAKGCTVEDCNNEGTRPRNSCLKTCKVFMDDDSEYMPGKERRMVLGY